MKKYVLAISSGALFGLSAQAAPVSTEASAVQNQVTTGVEKVWHCRYWSGGWGCGGGGWHRRWWSHRRWGSGGWYGHSRYWSHRRRGSYWR
jgi:hypothetical protein